MTSTALRYPRGKIIIFAKAPVPGQVKTRLAAGIGDQQAADIYRQSVISTVTLAVDSALAPVELQVSPDESHPLFRQLEQSHSISLTRQCSGDLGSRMAGAFQTALETRDFAILIGTDCPVMTGDYLEQACQALDAGRSVVLGPVEDGGYVLIGCRRLYESLFTDMPWSSDRVLALTQQRLRLLDLSFTELDTLWDLDTPEDLERLAALPEGAMWPSPGYEDNSPEY